MTDIKEIHNNFIALKKLYNKFEQGTGIAIKKDFSDFILPQLSITDVVEDEYETEASRLEREDNIEYISNEMFIYFDSLFRKKKKLITHPYIINLKIEKDLEQHFTIIFLFECIAPFECFNITLSNAVKYKVLMTDPFLIEQVSLLKKFQKILHDFINHLEPDESWFISLKH